MEHRCSKRAQTTASALIQCDSRRKSRVPARITNYSRGGMFLSTRRLAFKPLQLVDIEVLGSSRDTVHRLEANVVRVEKGGLAVELDPEDAAVRAAVESLREV